jgi:hypothetical protein
MQYGSISLQSLQGTSYDRQFLILNLDKPGCRQSLIFPIGHNCRYGFPKVPHYTQSQGIFISQIQPKPDRYIHTGDNPANPRLLEGSFFIYIDDPSMGMGACNKSTVQHARYVQISSISLGTANLIQSISPDWGCPEGAAILHNAPALLKRITLSLICPGDFYKFFVQNSCKYVAIF